METVGVEGKITVFLADDNVIVREGVRALLALEDDLEIVGVAGDYDELVAGAEAAAPQVLVTDIRMPPSFQSEGIDAAKELRKRHPGTGVVVLSQYDDPEYAVALLADGAAGYAYLLKDRIAEGNQLARAVREVATGGSVLDPKIVESLVAPVTGDGGLTADEERLLQQIAEGRPIKAIAATQQHDAGGDQRRGRAPVPQAVAGSDRGYVGLAASAADAAPGDRRPRRAGRDAEPTPADRCGRQAAARRRHVGETEELVVTVLMSDIRGYSSIAERVGPTDARASAQRAPGRDEPRDPRRDRHGDAVRRRRGDGVVRCARARPTTTRTARSRPRSRCWSVSAS